MATELPAECPVCGLPSAGAGCAGCGWPGGDADRLAAARRAFDSVAAARVSAGTGRDLGFIRGGRPDDAEWARAVARAAAAVAEPPGALAGTLAQYVADLADEERVAVVDVGGDGVSVTLVGPDPAGVLRAGAPTVTLWRDLPAAPDAVSAEELRFRLAGGGTGGPALAAGLSGAVAALVPAASWTVAVCSRPGWPVPEQTVEAVRRARPGTAVLRVAGADVEAAVRAALRAAPLRQKLELVVAQVDGADGTVSLGGETLFPAGSAIGAEFAFSVACRQPDPEGTVFTVIAWQGDRPRPLMSVSGGLRRGVHRVRARLADHGEVAFHAPERLPPERRTWAELMSALPHRLEDRADGLDVLCLIEQSGDFPARRKLAEEVARVLCDRLPGHDGLRLAFVGYGDHRYEPGHEQRKVTRGTGLVPPGEALAGLAELRPLGRSRLAVAPVEDALSVAVRHAERIPAGHRAVLLTIGDRPPHPPAAVRAPNVLPCPLRHDWRFLLDRLRRRLPSLVRLAVTDSPAGRGSPWRTLAGAAPHSLTDADPAALVAEMAVRSTRPLSFPLLHTP